MKQSTSLDICIVTSACRNIHPYQLLRDRLKETGHRVLDWTTIPGSEYPLFIQDAAGIVFDFCTHAASCADLVIYLAPGGQDAACLVGMASSAGVRTLGLGGFSESQGIILPRAIQEWFVEPAALLAAVEMYAEEKAQGGIV